MQPARDERACSFSCRVFIFVNVAAFAPGLLAPVRAGLDGSAGKVGWQRDSLMRQLTRCDVSAYGLLAVKVPAVYLKDCWHPAHALQYLRCWPSLTPMYFRFQ